MLDANPDVILRIDRQFRYTYVNAKTASVAGIPQDAFAGKTSAEVGSPQAMIDLLDAAMDQAFRDRRGRHD